MGELEQPPHVNEEEDQEILRVWVSPDGNLHVSLVTLFEKPGYWGVVLSDIAKHLGKAYEYFEMDQDDTIDQIHEAFESELGNDLEGVEEVKLH